MRTTLFIVVLLLLTATPGCLLGPSLDHRHCAIVTFDANGEATPALGDGCVDTHWSLW